MPNARPCAWNVWMGAVLMVMAGLGWYNAILSSAPVKNRQIYADLRDEQYQEPASVTASALAHAKLTPSVVRTATASEQGKSGFKENEKATSAGKPVPSRQSPNHQDREWALGISQSDHENVLWKDVVSRQCSVDFSNAVAKQLAPFKEGGISQEMMDRLYCIRKQVARVSVHNGKTIRQENWQLNMDHNRLRSAMWLLQLAARRAVLNGRPLPDVEFIVNPTDKTSKFASGRQQADEKGKELRQAPLFCNVKCDGDTSISFPLYFHTLYGLPDGIMSLKMYTEKHAILKEMGSVQPWAEKTPKMFFSATNTRGERANIFKLKSPHLSTLMQNVPLKKYAEYKYSVYTYGHSGWSRRLRELAFFNTTLFMEDSDCHEFFYHVLVPGEDFVLVQRDLADVPAKLEEAIDNPIKSESMAKSLVSKGSELLSMECLLDYIVEILHSYAELQTFRPKVRDAWQEHYLNSTSRYFLDANPPPIEVCRPYF